MAKNAHKIESPRISAVGIRFVDVDGCDFAGSEPNIRHRAGANQARTKTLSPRVVKKYGIKKQFRFQVISRNSYSTRTLSGSVLEGLAE